jgi:hypothetical protein
LAAGSQLEGKTVFKTAYPSTNSNLRLKEMAYQC